MALDCLILQNTNLGVARICPTPRAARSRLVVVENRGQPALASEMLECLHLQPAHKD
jgi:hypothetical protein